MIAYMESPMTSSHKTLGDLQRSKSGSLRFRSLLSCKGAQQAICYYEISLAICHLLHQLQVSSRAPRSMDLLFYIFHVFWACINLKKKTHNMQVQQSLLDLLKLCQDIYVHVFQRNNFARRGLKSKVPHITVDGRACTNYT